MITNNYVHDNNTTQKDLYCGQGKYCLPSFKI